jgi:hypothetical protein
VADKIATDVHHQIPAIKQLGSVRMIYILTLLVFSGGNVALTTAEYNNSEACEAAKAIDERAIASAFRQPTIVATCTPKG